MSGRHPARPTYRARMTRQIRANTTDSTTDTTDTTTTADDGRADGVSAAATTTDRLAYGQLLELGIVEDQLSFRLVPKDDRPLVGGLAGRRGFHLAGR